MGWLFGAGIGWFLGGPLGAVVGGALQHAMSGQNRQQIEQNHRATTGEQIFISNLVVITTKVCMADGSISQVERKTIHNFFSKALGYQGTELKFIDALMEETQRANPDLYQVCKAFDKFAGSEQRLLLLDLVYQVASADHVITKSEEETIQLIVGALGIGRDEHERIKSSHAPAKRHDHYTTLGLNTSAGNEEVKKTYRQLAAQYHPDKVAHLGPELIKFAEAKFKDIQEAYSAIRKERKI